MPRFLATAHSLGLQKSLFVLPRNNLTQKAVADLIQASKRQGGLTVQFVDDVVDELERGRTAWYARARSRQTLPAANDYRRCLL